MGTEAGRAWGQKRQAKSHHCRSTQAGGPASSSLDQLRSIRTVPQHPKAETRGGLTRKKLECTTPKRRVPATASLAWPLIRMMRGRTSEGSADCIENPNMHGAHEALTQSADGRATTA